MVRLILQLLALLALLLAPLPVAAAASPAPAMVAAEAQHCEQLDANASHQDSEEPREDQKHPCCKDSISSCCPAAAPLADPASPLRAAGLKPAHRAAAEIFVLGTSGPPLTEPPTFA